MADHQDALGRVPRRKPLQGALGTRLKRRQALWEALRWAGAVPAQQQAPVGKAHASNMSGCWHALTHPACTAVELTSPGSCTGADSEAKASGCSCAASCRVRPCRQVAPALLGGAKSCPPCSLPLFVYLPPHTSPGCATKAPLIPTCVPIHILAFTWRHPRLRSRKAGSIRTSSAPIAAAAAAPAAGTHVPSSPHLLLLVPTPSQCVEPLQSAAAAAAAATWRAATIVSATDGATAWRSGWNAAQPPQLVTHPAPLGCWAAS